jgi:hypothetical protein
MVEDLEQQEYFAILGIVSEFDRRLMTVKGWGVTLSLAALGFGFQHRATGLFLVATISSAAFWALEAAGKRHQMRYYVRMREIEVARYQRSGPHSAPRVDWSWSCAGQVLRGLSIPTEVKPYGKSRFYRKSFLMPHVAFPHIVSLLAGLALFALGTLGWLPGFTLGAAYSS